MIEPVNTQTLEPQLRRVMRDCLDRLAASERDAVLGGSAERCYLDPEIRSIGRDSRTIGAVPP
jgi:hypothetical protein